MHKKGVSKQLQLFEIHPYDAAATKLILVQSLPIILQYVISVGGWEFFYILIEHHGERALAISNIMRNIFGFFGCVTWAFASTTNSMVSNVIGQGLHHRVTELIIKIMRLSVAFSCIIFILLNIEPTLLLRIYGQDENFIIEAIPVVRVVTIAMLLMSVSTIWLNAVIGTGNSKVNLFIEIFAIVIYCVYVYVILEKLQLSVAFGWTSEWVYWLCIFIPSFLYLQSGKWKHKVI
jgi:Na+-driven multidrug efflux pump